MEFVVILVVLSLVTLFLVAPLRTAENGDQAAAVREAELAELEAARAAKYREISDAKLDHQTGKLSDEDFQTLEGSLRAEAITLLDAVERASPKRVDAGADERQAATIEPR